MSYFTLGEEARAEYEIQRSVFIASVRSVETFEEGIAFAKKISKEFSDATHNCYAFVLKNGEQKFSDDGEPQGTAGTPILQAIKNNDLTDTVCVVTRYFGGIKLGAGGLVQAYTKAAVLGLKKAAAVEKKESKTYLLNCTYSDVDTVKRKVAEVKGKVREINYGENVTMTLCVPEETCEAFSEKISEAFNGKKELTLLEKGYETY